MQLTLDTDTITFEDAQAALRDAYGRDAHPGSAPPVRPPYAGKFVLEPLPAHAQEEGTGQ